MNREGLTKAPILVVLLVVVLFVVANVGIMAGYASMQQQDKTGRTTASNYMVFRNVPASNNTSNSTSSIIKKGVTSGDNLSQKSTKSLPASIKPLSVSIKSSQYIVNGRGKLTISAIAYDATTGKKIENALVKLKILFTSNDTSKEIVGHDGEVIYSAEIKPDSKGNTNIAIGTTAQAFVPGYISATKTSISSSSTSIITSNGGSSGSSKAVISKASSNLAENILRNVKNRLEQNGINFSLGK
jgi:hypothetical protein